MVPFVPEKETAIVQQSQAIVREGNGRMPVPKCEYVLRSLPLIRTSFVGPLLYVHYSCGAISQSRR